MAMKPRHLNQMIFIKFDREFYLSFPPFITPSAPQLKFLGACSTNTTRPRMNRIHSLDNSGPMGIGISGKQEFVWA